MSEMCPKLGLRKGEIDLRRDDSRFREGKVDLQRDDSRLREGKIELWIGDHAG
jgi:hypothetical protein